MYTYFIVSIVLAWIFLFAAGASFRFKEEYKKFHYKLFERAFDRPDAWGISRRKNHDVYNIFRWAALLFICLSLIFGALYDLVLWFILFSIAMVIILPLGIVSGKYICHILVRRQCKKFRMLFQ